MEEKPPPPDARRSAGRTARLGLGALVYLVAAYLILDWDLGAQCYREPFHPRAITYVVTFPLPLLAWRDWLAEMPSSGISCDDFDGAMVGFLAFLGPLNGLLWAWAIGRTARAVRMGMS